jgi:integrase
MVAGKEFHETFATRALAESFRSKLVVAQREGVAFDVATGLPEPMAREARSRTWYEHAVAFVDMKWKHSSAWHRRSIADALATVTPALLATDRGVPSPGQIRAGLYGWAFNKTRRDAGPPPADLAGAIDWLRANTLHLAALADAAVIRKALDALALKLDGTAASANTVARKRTVFGGALGYAVELRLLDGHPFDHVRWVPPRVGEEVDRRVVVNPIQAGALLAAVRAVAPELEAFFGCLYYAALRPEEALNLQDTEYERPAKRGGWGRLQLTGATVVVRGGWTGQDSPIDRRGLKSRAVKATRDVPVPPALAELLDRHIARFPPVDGRLFVVRRGSGRGFVPPTGRPLRAASYGRVWQAARGLAFTPAQAASQLARRPYDLRHAAVSTWLNAGVPATQVAAWAGHSVQVLLRIYAKCIDGEDEAARRRIEGALGTAQSGPAPDDDQVDDEDDRDPATT